MIHASLPASNVTCRRAWRLALARFTIGLLMAGLPTAARSKVAFTGYADFRITPESTINYEIPASLAPGIGRPTGRIETRTSTLDSVGLFATSALADQATFLLDVTYRDIGYATRTVRLQYAYLDYSAIPDTTVRAGKITIPFGYLNQNRFYAFQQPSVTSPVYQSGFLGLPIADLGVAAERSMAMGPVTARLAGYAVNGYGPVPGSTNSFRSLSLPGGLTMANNIGSTDANKKVSGGGRLVAAWKQGEVGGSYYGGDWDTAGKRLLQMANAHVLLLVHHLEVLSEYFHLDVEDDAGMRPVFGSGNWRTDGYFVTSQYKGATLSERALTPWVRIEDYRSRGMVAGAGTETLRAYAGGASYQVLEGVAVKLEINQLIYKIPLSSSTRIRLDEVAYVAGLSLSF